MKRVARFYKVSREQFVQDWRNAFGEEAKIQKPDILYEAVQIPRRATVGSAGYDFFLPTSIILKPGQSVKVPTGIRVKMCDGWVLMIYPRSGLGFTYRLQLDNTVGIIDSDYFFSDNEGHIMIKMTNDSREEKEIRLSKGTAFAQGIFMEYGIVEDDDSCELRNGGFGSTSSQHV